MTRRFKPPVFASTKRGATEWTINLGDDERAIVVRLLGELRALLTSDDQSSPLLQRLFPPAFLDDPDKEAEYQRLMREELVTSRVAQIDTVSEHLRPGDPGTLDESGINAFLQSINAVRVVLGTLLDVGEDDDPSDDEMTPEHQLYAFLSWLLDWTVRSLSS